MGRSSGESVPIQPDGGLLSILGDILFGGAMLMMLYPCLRRTVSRIDRQFFRQFFRVSEIFLATVALCFVLILVIAQQMRVTYCSFIRPYLGNTQEDNVIVGVLLKILVCGLLVFNYFCASGLQQIASSFFGSFQMNNGHQNDPHCYESNARGRHPRFMTPREVLTNNSNTNSQTPVTQTQTVTHSDILPSMSFLVMDSKPPEYPFSAEERRKRLYRDVGTMVRFPEYQTSMCSLQYCRGKVPESCTASPSCQSTVLNPRPCQSPANRNLHRSAGSSMGFCVSSKSCQMGLAKFHSSYHQTGDEASSCHYGNGNTDLQYVCPGDSGLTSVGSLQSGLGDKNRSRDKLETPNLLDGKEIDVMTAESNTQGGPKDSRMQHPIDEQKSCQSPAGNASQSIHSHARSNVSVFRLPDHGSTVHIRKRVSLPSMPKVTRSGRVYGFG